MKNRIAFKLLWVLLLLVAGPMNSQKTIDTQQLVWLRYYLKIQLNNSFQLQQEVEERRFWSPWRQQQVITRTLVEVHLRKEWNAGMGMVYSLQSSPQDPEIHQVTNTAELRPLFELTFQQRLSEKIDLNHRFWSEFRFFEQTDGSFEYANNRTRYKLELNYKASSKTSLKVFDEILLNIGGTNVFDQNRYGASAQYTPLKNLGLELGYINWFQERPSATDFYKRHIMRFTLHQTISLKKTKTE